MFIPTSKGPRFGKSGDPCPVYQAWVPAFAGTITEWNCVFTHSEGLGTRATVGRPWGGGVNAPCVQSGYQILQIFFPKGKYKRTLVRSTSSFSLFSSLHQSQTLHLHWSSAASKVMLKEAVRWDPRKTVSTKSCRWRCDSSQPTQVPR